ncbi:hypothetical protein AURDEDRAFT_169814 [Auricularia subglabra TFB-10046 SS5]|nr:hypothetical protein AURDEDRAFT_169814 [Auricularia subglabra TFB-10046 SS5]
MDDLAAMVWRCYAQTHFDYLRSYAPAPYILGHFTTRDHFEVMGLPVISATSDRTSPAPILVWTPVYKSEDAAPSSWTEDIPFSKEFRLIHEVKLIPGEGRALDTVIVAGREGIVHLYYDEKASAWKYVVVGTGLPQQPDIPYWGSGSVDIAAVRDDPVGYIATCEAFHGNTVSVYLKRPGAPNGTASLYDASNWKRVQIDNYGPLDEKTHTGTIHHVLSADFDGTGVNGFAIACMGEPIGKVENQGVYIYRPTNLREGKFHRSKITDRSAARLAIAAFSGKTLDVASISYFVPGYHTGPVPASIRINSNAFFSPLSTSDIRVHRLDKEVLLVLPRPKRLHIVVLPPNGTAKYNSKDGVKVMHGEILMRADGGQVVKRGLAPDRRTTATTQILSSDGIIKAGAEGAAFMRLEYLADHVQGPYRTMADLPITNIFPNSAPLDVQALQFPFIKVDQLPWASNGNWDDFEFYNMTGFHVYFGDGAMDKICHIQLWTLGLYETARFHVHDTIPFCEIHCCIANGGGGAGMRWFPDEVNHVDPKLELNGDWVEERTDRLIYPPLYEHGPLWKVQEGYNAKPKLLPNGCADYPWHGWLASNFGDREIPVKPPLPSAEQSYDVWLAFEFPLSSFQY